MNKTAYAITALMLLAACGERQTSVSKPVQEAKKSVVAPTFDADSAYSFVKAQTDFGPRVPGTPAHQACGAWLRDKMTRYADTVVVQDFRARLYNGRGIDGQNIIAAFNPGAKKRVLLCAHWDSRPYADHDDEACWDRPIDGANDGASGVGVLIECARLLSLQPLDGRVGVDIIFFDLEDYGPRQDQADDYYDDDANHWALGSQHWAKHPHAYGYRAYYGILLDMVGGASPRFMKEYYSLGYAGWVVNRVWGKASELGHRPLFVNEIGEPVSDDHIPLNEAGIPTIDIIDLHPESKNGCFPEVWHTLDDNIGNICKETLGIVGEVVVNVIYNE